MTCLLAALAFILVAVAVVGPARYCSEVRKASRKARRLPR